MNTKHLGEAFGLVMKTWPITLVRLGASLVFWLALLVYLAIVGGVAWLVGQAVNWLGVILFLVAIFGMLPLYQLAYRYVFFVIKAAQIAVISEVLVHGKLPDGVGQLAYGRQRVTERFGEANVMFVVDELVSAVLTGFTNTVSNIANWLPSDSVRTLAGALNRIIHFALTYVDEAVLSRSFTNKKDNAWSNAADGVVLYAMAWKPLLAYAVLLMAISYIPFLIVFLLFSAPVGGLVALVNPTIAGWSIILVLALAWLVKVAIGDTFAMTAMIVAFARETAALTPDPAMRARLDQVSDKFRELQARGAQMFSGVPAAAPAADAELRPATPPVE